MPLLVGMCGARVFDACREVETALVDGVSPHAVIEPRHGFDVVVEDIGPRLDHAVDGVGVAQEIGREDFHRRPRTGTNRAHALVEMLRPTVRQVIARNRRNDHMFEPQPHGRLRHACRLVRLERFGFPLGTEQKPQGRVQTLPKIMNVAVRWDQHSVRLGHLALSQTVSSLRSSITWLVKNMPGRQGPLQPRRQTAAGRDFRKNLKRRHSSPCAVRLSSGCPVKIWYSA